MWIGRIAQQLLNSSWLCGVNYVHGSMYVVCFVYPLFFVFGLKPITVSFSQSIPTAFVVVAVTCLPPTGQLLVSWPIAALRRYGVNNVSLTIVTGRCGRARTWYGLVSCN